MYRARCVICESERLVQALDLGMHPFADRFIRSDFASTPDALYPLVVDYCQACGVVQNRTVTAPADRYADYSYTSSHSAGARAHWVDYAATVSCLVDVRGKVVLEVGSNDGFLGRQFFAAGAAKVIGVDPSEAMNELATQNGVIANKAYWDDSTVHGLGLNGGVDLAIANNVFNHAEEPRRFLDAVRLALRPGGNFVVQVPDLSMMIIDENFDQVYHEHVTYWTAETLIAAMARSGLHVWRVDRVPYHGVSLRLFATPADTDREAVAPFGNLWLEGLQERLVNGKRRVLSRLAAMDDRPIVCAGASAKGNTFLNWHRLDRTIVSCVTEVSPTKIGKLTPGSRIPIRDEATLAEMGPARVLVTAWNLMDQVKDNILQINPHVEFINTRSL
jgi:SAM-dependent methyltransferase